MAIPVPDSFELFDPGTGARLVGTILNAADYAAGDLLLVFDAAGKQLADGPADRGIVNISGLVTDTAVTLHARVLSGEELSLASNSDTETPTTKNVQLLTGSAAFRRVKVLFKVGSGTKIEWELERTCKPAKPTTFFVQFNHTPDLEAEDWVDVATVEDAFEATDPDQRLFGGMLQLAYYRIIMREPDGTETISPAQQAVGRANRHDFLIAREILRKELLRLEKFSGARGFLLKVKRFGDECPECLDFDTREVTDSDCPVCFGKGIIDGYRKPVEFFLELGLGSRNIDTDQNQGASEHIVRQCRAAGIPQLDHEDLWVRSDTDERFFIQEVSEAARLVIPLIVMCNLRKIPIDDPAYRVPVPA